MSEREEYPERFQEYRDRIQNLTPHSRTLRTLRFYAGETGRLDVDQRSEMDESLENFYQSAVADAVEIALEAVEDLHGPNQETRILEEQVSILKGALRDVFEILENEHSRMNEPIHNQELANQVANRAKTAYYSTAERAQERVESREQDGPERNAERWKALAELYRAGLLEIVKAEPTAPGQEIARGTLRDAEQKHGHPAGPGAPEDGQDE